MNKNYEPAGPRMISVLFIGVICLLIGMVLGLASLITQPATELTKAPEEGSIVPGEVYIIKGNRTGGTNWRQKEDAIRTGALRQVTLSEADLNRWSTSRLKPPKLPAKEEESWKDNFLVIPDSVNFNILEDSVQMSAELKMGGYLKDKIVTCAITGRFESSPNGVQFVPESTILGQAPVGILEAANGQVLNFLGQLFQQESSLEWLPSAFEELESIEIVDDQLVLNQRI